MYVCWGSEGGVLRDVCVQTLGAGESAAPGRGRGGGAVEIQVRDASGLGQVCARGGRKKAPNQERELFP